MVPSRFDRLTRSLLQPYARRRALALLATALVPARPVAAALPSAQRHAKHRAQRRCRSQGDR